MQNHHYEQRSIFPDIILIWLTFKIKTVPEISVLSHNKLLYHFNLESYMQKLGKEDEALKGIVYSVIYYLYPHIFPNL